jgi:hypothetical protein
MRITSIGGGNQGIAVGEPNPSAPKGKGNKWPFPNKVIPRKGGPVKANLPHPEPKPYKKPELV